MHLLILLTFRNQFMYCNQNHCTGCKSKRKRQYRLNINYKQRTYYTCNRFNHTGRLPKNVKVTLTEGTATHLDAEILSDINEQVHTATAKVNASSANIVVSSDLNATDTRVTNLSVVTVSGRTLVKANAVLTGHDMCNRSVV